MTHCYLLDTHVLVWWLINDKRLSSKTAQLLEDEQNDLYISTASLHEYAIKELNNVMPLPLDLLIQGLDRLDITIESFGLAALKTYRQAELPHKDPFDRALVAQAIAGDLTLITADRQLLDLNMPKLEILKA